MNILSRKILPWITIMLMASGCALSPQTLQLMPQVSTEIHSDIGRGRNIVVTANDLRTSNVLGNRGGLYSTSHLQTNSALLDDIVIAASDALRKWDFRVTSDNDSGGGATTFAVGNAYSADTDPSFTVDIISMQYETPDKGMMDKLSVTVTLSVSVDDDLRHYKGTYSSRFTHEYLFLPSEAKNNEIVSTALGNALSKAFADRKLQNFLEQ